MDATLNAILNTQSAFVRTSYCYQEPEETEGLYSAIMEEAERIKRAQEQIKRAQEELKKKELEKKPYIYIDINKNEDETTIS